MTQIAKTVRDYHSLGIVILALSPYNVYLKDKNDVFLADWSLARSKDDTEKIVPSFFTSKYDCLAKEVSQEGTFSASSDMYSLGKIFNKIQHSGYL
jgi:serine/threonine protein kinase